MPVIRTQTSKGKRRYTHAKDRIPGQRIRRKTAELLTQGPDDDTDASPPLDTEHTRVHEESQQGTTQEYGEVA